MTIGSVMRDAREAAGLTQVELAERAQIHRTYLSQLEHDHKSPTLDVFVRICEAMKVAPSKLMEKIERKR